MCTCTYTQICMYYFWNVSWSWNYDLIWGPEVTFEEWATVENWAAVLNCRFKSQFLSLWLYGFSFLRGLKKRAASLSSFISPPLTFPILVSPLWPFLSFTWGDTFGLRSLAHPGLLCGDCRIHHHNWFFLHFRPIGPFWTILGPPLCSLNTLYFSS